MPRIAEHVDDQSFLDQLAAAHDANAVADAHDGAEVVADEDEGELCLCLSSRMRSSTAVSTVTSRPVVSSNSNRDGSAISANDDPLLLASGQLVRIAAEDALGVRQLADGAAPWTIDPSAAARLAFGADRRRTGLDPARGPRRAGGARHQGELQGDLELLPCREDDVQKKPARRRAGSAGRGASAGAVEEVPRPG